MLKYSKAEILSLSVKDLHPAKGLKRALKGFHHLAKGLASVVVDIPMKRKDGSSFYADISCARVEFSGRKYLVGFFRDVSERKGSEEALMESEEMFRTFTERSPNMIFINQGGKVVYANPKCEEIMGYKREEFYSPRFSFLTLMHPDDVPAVRRSFFTHQKGKEVPPYEYKMLTKGGKLIRGILTSKLIHYRGAPAILGIITDISDRKKAEDALRESENRFRKIIEHSPIAMAIVSTEGVIEYINQKAIKVFGYLPKEIPTMERWWVQAYPDRDYRKEVIADWMGRVQRGIASGGEIKGSEYRVTCKDRTVKTMFISGAYIAGKIFVLFDDITERWEAAEALRESEKKYKHLIETTGTGYVALDEWSRVTDANPEYVRMTGRKKLSEILGHKVQEWTAPYDRERNKLEVKKCFKRGFVRNLEVDYQTPAGQIIPIEINATVIRDAGPVRIVTICRDITKRKRAETSLAQREAHISGIIENQPGMVWLKDTHSRFLVVNQKFSDVAGGKNPTKMIGKTDFDFWPKDLARRYRADDKRAMRTGKSLVVEEPILDRGVRKWHETFKTPVVNEKGRIIGTTGYARDITERKRTEAVLKESEEKFRAMFETSPSGMALCEMDGTLVQVNQAYLDIIGYTRKEALKLTYWDLTPKEYAAGEAQQLRSMGKTGRYGPYEKEYIRKTGERVPVLLNGAVVTGVDGKKRIWSVVFDITERKRAEEALKQSLSLQNATLESTADGILVVDREGKVADFNERFKYLWRIPKKVLATRDDKKLLQLVLKQLKTSPRFLARVQWYYAHPRKSGFDVLEFKDGRVFERETHPQWVENKPVGRVWSFRDVTERKKSEELLRNTAKEWRTTFNAVGDAVWLLSLDGRILQTNKAASKMLGKNTARILGQYCCEVMHSSKTPPPGCPLRRLRKSLHRESWETSFLNRWFRITVDPVLNERGALIGIVHIVSDITDRKRADEAVMKITRFNESIISSLPGIFYIFNNQGKFLRVNERFLEVTKYSLKQVYKMHPFDFFTQNEKAKVKDTIEKVFEKGESFIEADLLGKDGKKTPFYFTGVRVVIDGIPLLVGVGIDVTERRRAKEAVVASERRLAHLMADLPGMVYRCRNERDWPIFFVSEGCLPLTGHRKKDFESHRVFYNDLIHRDDQERVWNAVQEALAVKKYFELTYRIWTKKHEEKWVWERGHGVWNDSGEFMYLDGFITDITARKRAEDFLREHRHQLLQVIDTVPHMIFAEDGKGRFLLVNRAVAQAYGKEPRDLIGVLRQDMHKVREEAEHFSANDKEVLESGKSKIIPGEIFTDVHGRKHVLQTIKIPFRLVGAKEDCILGVSVDVTEQKKVEDFRNEIIRTVSHELRTPLSIQKEGISLLMDEMVGPISVGQKEILEAVMRSIDRLARMISNLLDVSSIETRKIKFFQKMTNLEDLIKDVLLEFKKRAFEKHIDLSMKPLGSPVRVLIDPDKITQVLSNLVDNAIKFTPEGGTVKISLAVLENELECEVRDSGIGITPENLGKAFEKFQQFSRTDGPGEKGFGLGLSIAKGIIELHGGRIWIKSEFGKGTCVMFSLPLYQGRQG